MEIRVGWATEYGAQKFDVSVGDTDLDQLLVDIGLGPSYLSQLNVGMRFQLLETTARIFALTESLRYITDQAAKASQTALAAAAIEERKALIARFKASVGAEEQANEPATA
jgi:hypothetical protein